MTPRSLAAACATLCTAALAAVAATAGPAAAAPPSAALAAKQATAEAVLAQVDALDRRFGAVVDAWDGGRLELAATRKQLAANRVDLAAARKASRAADARLGRRLVTIYEGDRLDLVQVLAGVSRLSDLIDLVEMSRAVAASDRRVAADARRASDRLAAARSDLRRAERRQGSTLSGLATKRAQIGAMLATRKRLLASVRSEIAAIEAREAAEQRRLAAAARARVAREQAALRAQAAERARAAAAQKQPAPAAPTTETATAPAPTTSTETVPAATTPAVPTTVPPPPAGPLPAGHPEAASIALRYLGVPYRWGGASAATGFDCSGLVMVVYAQLGIQLPHQAAAQYGYGVPVARATLQPGDLVFFDGLSHVGIYVGNGEVVHAPQTGDVVKISAISQWGGGYVGARRL